MKKQTYILLIAITLFLMGCTLKVESSDTQAQNESELQDNNSNQEDPTKTQEEQKKEEPIVLTDEKQLEDQQTQTNDEPFEEYQNSFALEGTKKLQLQWIEKQGKVRIEVGEPGAYNINGSITNNNDYLTINGEIIPLDDNRFKFVGIIESQVSYINNGQPCVRKATEDNFFVFLKKGGRKFYRLQQMNNCEGNNVVDYIDIYE